MKDFFLSVCLKRIVDPKMKNSVICLLILSWLETCLSFILLNRYSEEYWKETAIFFIDFYRIFGLYYGCQGLFYPNILQNIFFCDQQKKEIHKS